MAIPKKLPEVLTDTEVEAILNQFNPRYAGPRRNQLMIRLALATGMRISEITSLRFEDITPQGGAFKVHVKDAKGGKDRVLWISPDLYSQIVDTTNPAGQKAEGLIFCTNKGGSLDHGYLRRMIKARGRSAGIPRLHWHLLRHTALTRLYSNTRDLRLVQQVAGHSSPEITAIYAHISGEDIKNQMLHLGTTSTER